MLNGEWDNTCNFGRQEVLMCEICGQPFSKGWQLEIHQLTVAGSRWCR